MSNSEPSKLMQEFDLASQQEATYHPENTLDPSLLQSPAPLPRSIGQKQELPEVPAEGASRAQPTTTTMEVTANDEPAALRTPAMPSLHRLPHMQSGVVHSAPVSPMYGNSPYDTPLGSPAVSHMHSLHPTTLDATGLFGRTGVQSMSADAGVSAAATTPNPSDSVVGNSNEMLFPLAQTSVYQAHPLSISSFLAQNTSVPFGAPATYSAHQGPTQPAPRSYMDFPQPSPMAPMYPSYQQTYGMPQLRRHPDMRHFQPTLSPMMRHGMAIGDNTVPSAPQVNAYEFPGSLHRPAAGLYGLPMIGSPVSSTSASSSVTSTPTGFATKQKRVTKKSPSKATKTDERRFACEEPGCERSFKRAEHLRRHCQTVHSSAKLHQCSYPGCGRSFSRQDNLKQHFRSHARKEISESPGMQHTASNGSSDKHYPPHHQPQLAPLLFPISQEQLQHQPMSSTYSPLVYL